ncbi:MAG: tetratricopeptide repeat protein, partial [Bacteroidota bacterium]
MVSRSMFTLISIFILGLCISSCNSGENKKKIKIPTEASSVDSFPIYEEMLEKDSLNIGIRTTLAQNYYAVKQYEKAVFHFMIIYNTDSKNLTAIINLGNLYYDTAEDEKAIGFYEKALVIDSTNTNVRCDMATCYLNLKQPQKALTLLKTNIKMDYNHAQSHH